jgi:DNA-binding MarR family transcriptional regulator
MERDELIKRIRNNDDRRVFNFYLTPKAKKACQKLEAHSNTMNSIAGDSIPKKDLEKLNQLVSRVIDNLERFLETP